MNFVIKTATGAVLRFGYCDFENDGSFDAATETMVSAELPAGDPYEMKWNGGALEFNLDAYKEKKCRAINENTDPVLTGKKASWESPTTAETYDFAVERKARDEFDQKATQVHVAVAEGKNPFASPVVIPGKNDGDQIPIYNQGELSDVADEIASVAEDVIYQGEVLKAQVKAAADKNAVDAITDNR